MTQSFENTFQACASDPFDLDGSEVRMICAMRLVLAASALVIVFIDPPKPDRFAAITYAALILYTIQSLNLYALSFRRSELLPIRIMHWLDVAWYIPLIALSSGINSVHYYYFFFAILVASFRWGFSSGLRVTAVSTLLFTIIGYWTFFATRVRSEPFSSARC